LAVGYRLIVSGEMAGHRHRLILVVLLCALAAVASLPDAAERELGHAGDFGVHELVDSPAASGAICRFAPPLVWSMGETWIQVRPPVIFARDATSLLDEQLVGWRAVILNQDRLTKGWSPIATGETQRAVATENVSAPFENRGPEPQFHLGYGADRVRLELFWNERLVLGGEPRLAGQAEYEVENYDIEVRHRTGLRQDGVSDACQVQL
jgi:hypothetical protein